MVLPREFEESCAEQFGRVTGVCEGKGGSMHLFDPALNFMGGYAIGGGQFRVSAGLDMFW